MRLHALHHLTMITADAPRNVAFYADLLGLRLVKKTVNFDDPGSYHLYFGDETGAPGSILTWFEIPHAAPGRPGAGMIHTIELGVGSAASLDFWERRLADRGVAAERDGDVLRFADDDGLHLDLVVAANPPLSAVHPEVPAEHAITGVEGARAFTPYSLDEDVTLTEVLGFAFDGDGRYRVEGGGRAFRLRFEPAPSAGPGRPGSGTVHHIAWASADEEHVAWQQRVRDAGGGVSPVMDRDYFRSIYFRIPQGLLFEIATLSPGFAVDEDPDRLGEELRLPAMHAHLRERLEQTLTPLANPRTAVAS